MNTVMSLHGDRWLLGLTVVTISSYMQISNHYAVHQKLM